MGKHDEYPEDGECDLCDARVGNTHLVFDGALCEPCVDAPRNLIAARAEIERLKLEIKARTAVMVDVVTPSYEKLEAHLAAAIDLLKRAQEDEAVCVCHLRMGGCWPCETESLLRAYDEHTASDGAGTVASSRRKLPRPLL